MKGARPSMLAVAALCAAAFATPPATGQVSSDAKTGAGGSRAKSAKPAQAKSQTQPAKRKVWTNADLKALRNDPSAQVLVLESKRIGPPATGIRHTPAVQPEDVARRYEELAKEAEAKVAELQREKLAGTNPFLRGLASQTGGPRKPEEIEADLQRWAARAESARQNLDRARQLTGAPQPPTAPR